MPITYSPTTINAIADGQAITAANLNAPSTDLQTRTVEIQNNDKYNRYLRDHESDISVKLVPNLEPNEDYYVTITSRIKGDGGSPSFKNRSYSVDLTSSVLSAYAKAVPGSRFIIPGGALSSFFANTASQQVCSNELFVPGDGIYLKLKTKLFRGADSESNYQENHLPNTNTRSQGNNYLASPAVTVNPTDLVKLPLRSIITETAGSLTLSDFLASINTANAFGDSKTYTASVDSTTNVLSIVEGSNTGFKLRLTGLQQAVGTVSKLYVNSDNKLVWEISSESTPVRTELTSASFGSAGVILTLVDSGNVEQGTNNAILTANPYSFTIAPSLLDPESTYIPLVRLTETSLEVGDHSFSLVRGAAQDGAEATGVVDLPDSYGAPIEYFDSSAADGTKSLVYNLLSRSLPTVGKVSLVGSFDVSSNSLTAQFTKTKQFQYLMRNLAVGRTIYCTGYEVDVLQTFTHSGAATFNIAATTYIRNSSDVQIVKFNPSEAGLSLGLLTAGSSLEFSANPNSNKLTVQSGSANKPSNKSTSAVSLVTNAGSFTAGAATITLHFLVK